MSVRSADEVGPALEGGADIIDAKEPDRGSLGPVPAGTLAQIFRATPENQPVSVALGDFASVEGVAGAIGELTLPPRTAPTYLKLGFAGVQSAEAIFAILGAAVRLAGMRRSPPHIVAVAYADAARARALPPDVVRRLAWEAHAVGVLVDTHTKDGTTLLDWLGPTDLAAWVLEARNLGLMTAVAGALGSEDLPSVSLGGPHIIGFRGAACDGGRAGRVSAGRVSLLRGGLDGRPIRRVVLVPEPGESRNA